MALSTNIIPVDPDVGNIANEISNIVINHLKESGREVPEPFSSETDSPLVDPTAGELR